MKYNKPISKNISYSEATKSRTAINYNIDNSPTIAELSNMQYIADNVFEKIREHFCVPISVSSFYRSKELNKKLKGAKSSQHITGEAMDLDADVYGIITNRTIFNYIKDNLEFDQLIWEFGDDNDPDWVHVSLTKGKNRKEILKAYKEKDWRGVNVIKYKHYED